MAVFEKIEPNSGVGFNASKVQIGWWEQSLEDLRPTFNKSIYGGGKLYFQCHRYFVWSSLSS
jgi:hypothetical protein